MSLSVIIFIALAVFDIAIYGFAFRSIIWSNDNNSPEILLQETEQALIFQGEKPILTADAMNALSSSNVWAMFLSPAGEVIWSLDLPTGIPTSFTIQDVASFSRGYLEDYPVFVRTNEQGILVLGYPQDAYTKFVPNYYSIKTLQRIPIFIICTVVFNLTLLFLAYYFSKRNIVKSISPIVMALDKLSHGELAEVHLHGDLEEIGASINNTSNIMQQQNIARANWLSGISHDIRTPLSMIMGYADRICKKETSSNVRAEVEIIRLQSKNISALVQDLNLVSQLEYEMQHLRMESENPAKLLREVVAEYLNNVMDSKYTLELKIQDTAHALLLDYDHRLLKRAIQNLVNNSMAHNPEGCFIQIEGQVKHGQYCISVSDNGVGISQAQLKALKTKPHYLSSTDSRLDLRHGLGLLLARQITRSHDGTMQIDGEVSQGFKVLLSFPISNTT